MKPEPSGVSLSSWWKIPALSWMPDCDIVMQAGWVTAAQSQGWASRNTNTTRIHSHSWIKHPAVSVQQTLLHVGRRVWLHAEILMMLSVRAVVGALSLRQTACSWPLEKNCWIFIPWINISSSFQWFINKRSGGFWGDSPAYVPRCLDEAIGLVSTRCCSLSVIPDDIRGSSVVCLFYAIRSCRINF